MKSGRPRRLAPLPHGGVSSTLSSARACGGGAARRAEVLTSPLPLGALPLGALPLGTLTLGARCCEHRAPGWGVGHRPPFGLETGRSGTIDPARPD